MEESNRELSYFPLFACSVSIIFMYFISFFLAIFQFAFMRQTDIGEMQKEPIKKGKRDACATERKKKSMTNI